MREPLKNRFELVFAYDVKDGNPNGDPLDENKPRLDEALGINLVTDVRLKRTIRDELAERGEELWVSGEAVTSQKRAEQILERAGAKYEHKAQVLGVLLEHCIDLRLFGGTLPLKLANRKQGEGGEGVSLTGPVQFRLGRSLHRVAPVFMQGTAAFGAKETAGQRSFREEWLLPYSFIVFYGVVNQNAARDTGLTEGDVMLMFEAMWNGTKNLITRSKMEQLPRFLLALRYREEVNLHIGELDKYLALRTAVPEEQLRDVRQFKLEIGGLKAILQRYDDRLADIYYKVDDRLVLSDGERVVEDVGDYLGLKATAFAF